MAATDILEYLVWLLWCCLTLTPAKLKNPVFAMVLATEDVLQQLLSDSLLVFAPGLLDVLQSTTPPTVSYFKSLPICLSKFWAVYLLILEKQGCRPRIYIGSGTHTARGIAGRFSQYDTKTSLPICVEQALNDGFAIVHKGLLCWCPIPAAGIRFLVRALLIALEATFSFVLWAMRSRTKDYGMPYLYPWSLEDIEYDGCCTHSALLEAIQGEEDGLTLEEIAAKQVKMEQTRKEKHVALSTVSNPIWRAADRASRTYACDICDEVFNDSTDLARHNTSQKHIDKAAGVTKVLKQPEFKDWTTNNIAKKRYHCKICDKTFAVDSKLQRHRTTQKHIEKAAAAAESTKSSS